MNTLFSPSELRQPPLAESDKKSLARRVIDHAQLGIKYMYEVRETAGLLHITYDEIQTLLNFYRLDCTVIRDTIIRIPWWSLAEYLIDPADDMETALQNYIKSLPHRETKAKKIA